VNGISEKCQNQNDRRGQYNIAQTQCMMDT